MKIISKYNDYYDAIMRMGHDEHIIFHRIGWEDDPIEIIPVTRNWHSGDVRNKTGRFLERKLNEDFLSASCFNKNNNIWRTARFIKKQYDKTFKNDTFDVAPILIGFCGKFYIIYEVNTFIPKLPRFIVDENDGVFNVKEKSGTFKPIIGETPEIIAGNPDEIFLEFDAPIFVLEFTSKPWNKYRLIKNPVLREYDFQRIYDPYSAYQELSMYFGSVFANDEDHMVKISDSELAESKGFDKWSFRKMPQKKRK